jgi:UDP-N-acetyl-D-glucosamine dehydrogenase
MKIAVIGLGYVGFPLACAIARNSKYQTVGFDLSEEKINLIKSGYSPVEDAQAEKDIQEISLEVSTNEQVLENTDIFLVCVPTPIDDKYLPDLNPVKNAVKTCAKYLKREAIMVIESTINPGVCDDVVIPLAEKISGMKCGVDFDIAHCPERINPGDKKWNVYNIPRNVGASTPKATKKIVNFYRDILISGTEVREMATIKEAEATKIIENTFRDINIAYVNELAKSFDMMGIDLENVIQGASNKPFAFMPHFPSCGVGGHCIPVDPYYLIEKAKNIGFDHKFLQTARDINNSMPAYTIEKLMGILSQKNLNFSEVSVGVLGVSYKANIGDQRESPALKIIESIQKKSPKNLEIFDPYCPEDSTVENLEKFLEKVDVVVLATNHQEFLGINADLLQSQNIFGIVDGKNFLDKKNFENSEVIYVGIGRGHCEGDFNAIYDLDLSIYDNWNEEKKSLAQKSVSPDLFFYEREVWWCTLGKNIGREQDGKGTQFRRPVLILKKFGAFGFFGIPLTTQKKNGNWFHPLESNLEKGKNSWLILLQGRFFSSNRLSSKLGMISFEEYVIIQEKIAGLYCQNLK